MKLDESDFKKQRVFVPLRLVLDFTSDHLDNSERVLAEGNLLHESLTAFLSESLDRPVKVVFVQTLRGSLDHRTFVEIGDDIIEGLTDSAAEVAAAQWLVRIVADFLDEKYKSNITKFLVTAGILRHVQNTSELPKENFPVNERVATIVEHYRGQIERDLVESPANEKNPAGRTDKLALGITSVVLLSILLFWNIYRQHSLDERLDSILAKQYEKSTRRQYPQEPVIINIKVAPECAQLKTSAIETNISDGSVKYSNDPNNITRIQKNSQDD